MQKQWVKGVALTPREYDVCALLRAGCPPRVIAERLVVEPVTVHWHTLNLRGKFGVGSTYELLRLLMSEGE